MGIARPLVAVLLNMALAYAMYTIARVAYWLENYSYFADSNLMELFGGGVVFDTSAILVTNIPYVVLALLIPFQVTANGSGTARRTLAAKLIKALYLAINGLALAVNLADAVYFRYTMRRTTTTVFGEFSNEGNLGSIVGTEFVTHWYLVVLFIIVMVIVARLYTHTDKPSTIALRGQRHAVVRRLAVGVLSMAVLAPFVVAGIRGGFTTAVRPITISNANQYANRPIEAALVLNTPFSLYRTIGKSVFTVPHYYDDTAAMEAVYSPVRNSHGLTRSSHGGVEGSHGLTRSSHGDVMKRNVVVLIVESFGREYIGALNTTLDGGSYRGYTPFTDSLISRSTTFRYSYCNGRKSIDGMPSILSSIPMFVEPFFLTPASMNQVSGIAALLRNEGWHTAFFHGAQRGSMGFQAFARATGFNSYYGREDYCADSRFGGDADFDGTWAIWDEPFMQYYAAKMSEMKQPFMTALFTASSHHPYAVPDKYRDRFPEEGIVIHKCIRYTDMALSRFFHTAAKQPWYKNTLFVITSDHTNLSDHAYYQTDLGGFCSPIILFDPSGELLPEPAVEDKVAQQIDIMPTVLALLGYRKPYVAFGIDVMNTPADETWAVNYLNGIYQYVEQGHVLQFDGQKTRAVYALDDSLMQRNLVGRLPQQLRMEQRLKAIIQQYMERMAEDRLTVK